MLYKKKQQLLLVLTSIFLFYLFFNTIVLLKKQKIEAKNALYRLSHRYENLVDTIKTDKYLYINGLFQDRKEELIELYPPIYDILAEEHCGLESFYLTDKGLCYGFYKKQNTYSIVFAGTYLDDYFMHSDILLCSKHNAFGRYKELCSKVFSFNGLEFLFPVHLDLGFVGARGYTILKVSFINVLYLIFALLLLYYLLGTPKNLVVSETTEQNLRYKELEKKLRTLEREYKGLRIKYINETEALKRSLKDKKNIKIQSNEEGRLDRIKTIIYTLLSTSIKPLKTKVEGLRVITPPKVKRYVKAIQILRDFYKELTLLAKVMPELEENDFVIAKELLNTRIKKLMLNLHTLEETMSVIGLTPMVEELKMIDLLKKENTKLNRQIEQLKLDSVEFTRLKLSLEKILKIIEGED